MELSETWGQNGVGVVGTEGGRVALGGRGDEEWGHGDRGTGLGWQGGERWGHIRAKGRRDQGDGGTGDGIGVGTEGWGDGDRGTGLGWDRGMKLG